jgi:hypothetical protein
MVRSKFRLCAKIDIHEKGDSAGVFAWESAILKKTGPLDMPIC